MLLLDPRAGSIELHRHLQRLHLPVELCELRGRDSATGPDAEWIGNGPDGKVNCCVEIKHLPDLLQSLETGRLPAKQLLNMRENYDIAYLLIQDRTCSNLRGGLMRFNPPTDAAKLGMVKGRRLTAAEQQELRRRRYEPDYYHKGRWVPAMFGRSTPMQYAVYRKRLASIAAAGVRIFNTGDNDETARAVGAEYSWWREPWSSHKSLRVFDETYMTLTRPSGVASGLHAIVYGIGWVRAFAAAEHFGTMQNAGNAGVEEWRRVPGIDKIIAERAFTAFRTEHVARTVSGRRTA